MRCSYGLNMAIMNWIRYCLSMDMDIGKNMARHSTGIDGFYSSPRSWILEQAASFVNSGIRTVIVSRIHIFASHRLSDKPRTATNSALLFGLSQSCKSIQINTCGFLSIKLLPFHRDKYRETRHIPQYPARKRVQRNQKANSSTA